MMRIPRILWRIWIDDPMPPMIEWAGREFQRLHPDWDFREIRSRAEVPKLINQDLFDRARQIVPHDWKRFQADLLRLELLYLHGGIYADTDVVPVRQFDPLLDLDQEVLVAWSPNSDRHGHNPLTQAVLGSTPGHLFIEACIKGIPDAVKRFKGNHLAKMVGPWHLTRTWERYCLERDPCDVVPLSAEVFYPASIKERDREVNLLEAATNKNSYCIHLWNTTLRKQGKGIG